MNFVALERLFRVRCKGNTVQSLREYIVGKANLQYQQNILSYQKEIKKKMLGFYQNYSEELLTKPSPTGQI